MAIPLINQLRSTITSGLAIVTSAVDVVGIYDQDFVQLFDEARPMKAVVHPSIKPMTHPVEDGSTITDYRVVNPIEISLSMILQAQDYSDVYKQMYQTFRNGTLLVIQTRSGVFLNQMIYDMPTEEDPAFYDTLLLNIKCIQVQLFTTVTTNLSAFDPSNNTTVDRGQQQATPANDSQTKKSSALFKAFGGLLQ